MFRRRKTWGEAGGGREDPSESLDVPAKARNVLLTLLGVAGLVLKGRYSGPYQAAVHSYGGNIAASFAAYFVLTHLPLPQKFRRLAAAGMALAVVELFEATNGFQVMTNVHDPADYAANAVGIVLALLVDAAASRIAGRGSK